MSLPFAQALAPSSKRSTQERTTSSSTTRAAARGSISSSRSSHKATTNHFVGQRRPQLEIGTDAPYGSKFTYSGGRKSRLSFVVRRGVCDPRRARLDTKKWKDLDAKQLDNAAAALGPSFNIFSSGGSVVAMPPAFIHFDPPQFLREYDLAHHHGHHGH